MSRRRHRRPSYLQRSRPCLKHNSLTSCPPRRRLPHRPTVRGIRPRSHQPRPISNGCSCLLHFVSDEFRSQSEPGVNVHSQVASRTQRSATQTLHLDTSSWARCPSSVGSAQSVPSAGWRTERGGRGPATERFHVVGADGLLVTVWSQKFCATLTSSGTKRSALTTFMAFDLHVLTPVGRR